MINDTGSTENTSSQAVGFDDIKALGRKSLEPLVGVLSRHKGDFSPYLDAITKALKAGSDSLQAEQSSDAEKYIAQYFNDGAEWIGQWKEKLSVNSSDDFIRLLEEEGRQKPAILFGASYFAGLLLGRFGRHLGKTMRTSTDSIH